MPRTYTEKQKIEYSKEEENQELLKQFLGDFEKEEIIHWIVDIVLTTEQINESLETFLEMEEDMAGIYEE